MIETLHIKNFQVFEDIEIKGLRRVNLIAGKNNSGKTAMLEALRILAARGRTTVVNNIISERGNFRKGWNTSYEALFNRKKLSEAKDGVLSIVIGNLVLKRKAVDNEPNTFSYLINPGDSEKTYLNPQVSADDPDDVAVFLPFISTLHNLESFWQQIVLTPQEDEVFEIIQKTVEPRLIRLDMTGGITKVRLKGENTPVPLSSLGDGVQRILLLAIALVSAKNKLLIIDEFEAGLHHSVQKKLWEMVFEYAVKWDIQVFATTHSQDTVRNFFYVASRPQYEKEATYLRLQFDRLGVHEAIVYDMELLEKSLELHLETR